MGRVFERTVEWAIEHGIETATFHILTPYPGTALYRAHAAADSISRPRLGSLRHAARRLPPRAADAGGARRRLHWAYREFYRWKSIARGAAAHGELVAGLRHFGYSAGWKKFEPLWDVVIRAKRAGMMLPVLETILSEFGRRYQSPPRLTAEAQRRKEFLQEDPKSAALVGRG